MQTLCRRCMTATHCSCGACCMTGTMTRLWPFSATADARSGRPRPSLSAWMYALLYCSLPSQSLAQQQFAGGVPLHASACTHHKDAWSRVSLTCLLGTLPETQPSSTLLLPSNTRDAKGDRFVHTRSKKRSRWHKLFMSAPKQCSQLQEGCGRPV